MASRPFRALRPSRQPIVRLSGRRRDEQPASVGRRAGGRPEKALFLSSRSSARAEGCSPAIAGSGGSESRCGPVAPARGDEVRAGDDRLERVRESVVRGVRTARARWLAPAPLIRTAASPRARAAWRTARPPPSRRVAARRRVPAPPGSSESPLRRPAPARRAGAAARRRGTAARCA